MEYPIVRPDGSVYMTVCKEGNQLKIKGIGKWTTNTVMIEYNIDSNLFELKFNPPLNFASSRQASLDAERINTYNTIQAVPYMSKRFVMKRYLGLTEEEINKNASYVLQAVYY